MFEVHKTDEFDEWLKNLKNPIAKKAVIGRLLRLEMGHFGDIDNVGDGIFELRIHVSSGVRVYCIQKGDTLIIALNAGIKSTQQADINKAKQLNQEWEKNHENDQV